MKHLMLHFSRGGTHGSSDRLGIVAWENVVKYLTFHDKAHLARGGDSVAPPGSPYFAPTCTPTFENN